MFSCARRRKWFPKYIGFFAAPAFFLLVIFSRSEWKIRFLEWGAGGVVVVLMLLFFLLRGRISKRLFSMIVLPLAWTGYAFILTPLAQNPKHHLAMLLQTFLLTLIANFVVITLFSKERLLKKTVFATIFFWIFINIVFFLFWRLGVISYEKGDFSGIFGNRNGFAVQTVVLIGMLLHFSRTNRFLKVFLVFSSFVLISASLSTKGFLFFFFVIFFPSFLKRNISRKILVSCVGIFFFTASYAYMPNIQERITRFAMVFTNPDDLRQSESAFLRAWLMVEGFNLIVNNPITGVGVDNARFILIPPLAQIRGAEEGLYSHNNYVEMALNAGVIGLLLFYGPLIYVFFKTKNDHPNWIEVKTFVILYLLKGVAMVQYDHFVSILLYCIIMFLFLYYNGYGDNEKNSVHS